MGTAGMAKSVRNAVGALVASAMIVTGAAPALAAVPVAASAGWHGGVQEATQGYWGGRRYRHHRRHRGDGISTGGVIAGVAIVGVLAAVLSSAEKSRREQDPRGVPPLPPRGDDRDYRGDRGDDRDYDRDYDRDRPDTRPGAGAGAAAATDPGDVRIISGEDDAVDSCAAAAEREADRFGSDARVRDIDSADGQGREWDVRGTVETREGYRTQAVTHRFTCTVRYGQIERVDIVQGAFAAR